MPLSEHEQRLLDQIERGLYAQDPKLAHAVRATDPHTHYKRRMVKATIGFVAGVCLLMAGVISKIIPIGVAGFVVMLACCVWGLSGWKRMTGIGDDKLPHPSTRASDTGRSHRPSRARLMERLEERWRRRREQDGR